MSIDDLLKDKETTHGHFDDTATIAQTIKAIMKRAKNWESLPNPSKEALEMIATKIARILNGDATNAEHWLDICGYARLRANSFEPGLRKPDGVEAGIASIAQRLRPVRVNDEGGSL